MSYPNAYLRDFVPVLGQILKEKQIAPEKLHLEIIDEESEEKSIFEPVGVDEVLDQLADELILRFTQTVRRIFRHLRNKSMRKTV
jgi:hypothetical protein